MRQIMRLLVTLRGDRESDILLPSQNSTKLCSNIISIQGKCHSGDRIKWLFPEKSAFSVNEIDKQNSMHFLESLNSNDKQFSKELH